MPWSNHQIINNQISSIPKAAKHVSTKILQLSVHFKIWWEPTSHFFHFVSQFCWHQGNTASQSTLTDGLASALWSMICNLMLLTDMKVAVRELLLCLYVFNVIYSALQHFLPKYMVCTWILWCFKSGGCILICIMSLHIYCFHDLKQ